MQEQKVKEAEYCTLDILPAQYFLQAGAADIRCIYLRHSAEETIFTESRDKEPAVRAADCNNKLSRQCNA